MKVLKYFFVVLIFSLSLYGWGGKSTLKELSKFQE